MAVSQIYEFGGHLDHVHDDLPDYRRRQIAAARAEELAVYGGETVTVEQGRYRVTGGTVRNRTKRGA